MSAHCPVASQDHVRRALRLMLYVLLSGHAGLLLLQVTCELGGSEDQRLLLINLRCVIDTLAMMATDPKGPSSSPPPTWPEWSATT